MIQYDHGRMVFPEEKEAPDGWYATIHEFAAQRHVSETCVRHWIERGLVDAIWYRRQLYISVKQTKPTKNYAKKQMDNN